MNRLGWFRLLSVVEQEARHPSGLTTGKGTVPWGAAHRAWLVPAQCVVRLEYALTQPPGRGTWALGSPGSTSWRKTPLCLEHRGPRGSLQVTYLIKQISTMMDKGLPGNIDANMNTNQKLSGQLFVLCILSLPSLWHHENSIRHERSGESQTWGGSFRKEVLHFLIIWQEES